MMKYRDHSLNYVPRSTKRPAARLSEPPASIKKPDLNHEDDSFLRLHSNDTEPLINVNDTESRVQKIKDGLGTFAHAGAHITTAHIAPSAKKHVKNVTTRMRSHTKNKLPVVVSNAKKIHRPKGKLYVKFIILAAIFCAGYYAATHTKSTPFSRGPGTSSTQPVGGTSPSYKTLIPSGTTIEELGGWKRVSPPDGNPVFAYVDSVDEIQISVSQQPLPDDFSTDPDKDVKDLAQGFNASNRRVADDATVYFIGTSTKGPQSVIVAKQKTLILIKSMSPIKDSSWSRYIASLR